MIIVSNAFAALPASSSPRPGPLRRHGADHGRVYAPRADTGAAPQPASGKMTAAAMGALAGLAVAGRASKRGSKGRSPCTARKANSMGSATTEFGDGYSYNEADLIGSGAYGKVYKCKDKEGKEWAVKIVFVENLEKLDAEIEVHKHIGKHENVVELVEAVEIEGYKSGGGTRVDKLLVMELAKGGELRDKIEEMGKFSEQWSKGVFKQVASGIEHLHKKNVLHRDIKLDNVLISTDSAQNPSVKLIDFGAAHWARDGPLEASTYYGTIQTIAPEVIVARGDVFDVTDASQVESTQEIVFKKRPFGIRKYRPGPGGVGAKVKLLGEKPRYPGDPIGQALVAGVQEEWAVKAVNGTDVGHMTMDDIIDTMGDRLLDNSSRGAFDGSFAVTGDNKGKGKVEAKVEPVELPVTVQYAVMKPKPYGAKADVWSLGAMLYHMVTGETPFAADEDSVSAGIFKKPAGVSAALADLLGKMLVVDVDKRASLEEVLAHPWLK